MRRLIAEGELGEVVHFESRYDRFRPTVVDRWKEKPGADVWQDLGPHLVDQALQLFGMPRRSMPTSPARRTARQSPTTPTSCCAILASG